MNNLVDLLDLVSIQEPTPHSEEVIGVLGLLAQIQPEFGLS